MKDFKLYDVLMSVLIIFITLMYFFTDSLFPPGLKTVNVLGFEVGSFGFPDTSSFTNFIKTKILILLYASIWFITCKYWWKSAILIPIIIELVKLFLAFNSSVDRIDVIDYLISLPITIPFIFLLFYISHKLNSYNLKKELRTQIDDEIDEVFFQIQKIKIDELKELKSSLTEIKNKRTLINSEDYLKKIISIRNKFYKTQ
ncbi:hypothetical protein [Psychroserpens mesophilus]|uniref:hypothetical protein n=1 Tax=Psychroserpens mesophilus TaxID=325473 RepID=UPI003D657557